MKFANRLKELRTSNKLTQEDLANKINVGKSLISMYEKGNRKPSISNLEKLAVFFNVNLDYLVGNSDYTTKSDISPDYFTTVEDAVDFLLNQKVTIAYIGMDINRLNDDDKSQFINKLLEYTRFLSYSFNDKD